MGNKKNLTRRLDALGITWENGIDTKQPVNDGISPNAYQVTYKPGGERGSTHYLYSLKDLIAFIERKGKEQTDEALEWDDRPIKGEENEGFARPSQELIFYARSHNIHMNLWSRIVQRVLQLRIQIEKKEGQPALQTTTDNWRLWDR